MKPLKFHTMLFTLALGCTNTSLAENGYHLDPNLNELYKQDTQMSKKHLADKEQLVKKQRENQETLDRLLNKQHDLGPNQTYKKSIDSINAHLKKVTGTDPNFTIYDHDINNRANKQLHDFYDQKDTDLMSTQKLEKEKHLKKIKEAQDRAKKTTTKADSAFKAGLEQSEQPKPSDKTTMQSQLSDTEKALSQVQTPKRKETLLNSFWEQIKRFFSAANPFADDYATERLKNAATSDTKFKDQLSRLATHLERFPGQEARLGNRYLDALSDHLFDTGGNTNLDNNAQQVNDILETLNKSIEPPKKLIVVSKYEFNMPSTIDDIEFKVMNENEINPIDKNKYSVLTEKDKLPVYIKNEYRKNISHAR